MKFLKYKESNKNIRIIEILSIFLLSILSIYLFINNNISIALSSIILILSILVILLFGSLFTRYEKIWFISIMLIASIVSILDNDSEVNTILIMFLYLIDTFLNIICELLISKQSRFNFLISILVEITEIVTYIILSDKIVTLATTLLFWLPIDIFSFIYWSKHIDDRDNELTIVRSLKGYQEVLVIIGIIIWTILVGYLISRLDIENSLFKGEPIKNTIAIYLDACISAVAISNGLFIYFRLKEQWISWFIDAILELIYNILSKKYILIVLNLGFITNSTYGYIKWSKYIKDQN